MRRDAALRQDQAAVSDVLGAILLVSITVASATAFGVVLLAFDGPSDVLRVSLEMRTTRGVDGAWGTGDERVELVHLGGEPMPASSTTVRFTADLVESSFSGASGLASAFSDGELTIGEVWESPASTVLDLDQEEPVDAQIVSGERRGTDLLASGTVTGGGIVLDVGGGGGGCSPDDDPPTVSISRSPSNLNTNSGTTAVAVTVTGADACGTVRMDNTAEFRPNLWYRISPGPLPGPTAYTDLGDMAVVPGPGSTSWTLNVPAPTGGWSLAWQQVLQVYVTGVTDTNGNVLDQSSVSSDIIDLVGSSTFAEFPIAVAGQFLASAPFTNMAADDGLEAQYIEACTGGPPSANDQVLCAASATGVGVTSANLAVTSDNQRSSHSGVGSYVAVYGFDVPAAGATFTRFTATWEGQRSAGSGTNPTVQMEYILDAACPATGIWATIGAPFSPTTSDTTVTSTAVSIGLTTIQVESLCVRARVTSGTRAVLTDQVYITPRYSPPAPTTYDLNLELGWSGLTVPASSTGLFEMEYRVGTGESYTVEKSNGAGGWTACTGAASSTTSTLYRCSLTFTELSSGSPSIRILGTVDAAAASTLRMDHARMVVFTP
jgi:FlaG/FlaF family flagellin (archaellin)